MFFFVFDCRHNVNLVWNLYFCHVKAPLWEWAVVPIQPVNLALKLLLAGCHPVGVGDTLVAGGRQFLADNRSKLSAGGHGFGPAPGMSDCFERIRDHDKWGFFWFHFFCSCGHSRMLKPKTNAEMCVGVIGQMCWSLSGVRMGQQNLMDVMRQWEQQSLLCCPYLDTCQVAGS